MVFCYKIIQIRTLHLDTFICVVIAVHLRVLERTFTFVYDSSMVVFYEVHQVFIRKVEHVGRNFVTVYIISQNECRDTARIVLCQR